MDSAVLANEDLSLKCRSDEWHVRVEYDFVLHIEYWELRDFPLFIDYYMGLFASIEAVLTVMWADSLTFLAFKTKVA